MKYLDGSKLLNDGNNVLQHPEEINKEGFKKRRIKTCNKPPNKDCKTVGPNTHAETVKHVAYENSPGLNLITTIFNLNIDSARYLQIRSYLPLSLYQRKTLLHNMTNNK